MFESKRRDRLEHADANKLATDRQLWTINQLCLRINNLLVEIEELGGRAFMDVYCDTMRINLPIMKRDASKAIHQLKDDFEFKQRELERCKADA